MVLHFFSLSISKYFFVRERERGREVDEEREYELVLSSTPTHGKMVLEWSVAFEYQPVSLMAISPQSWSALPRAPVGQNTTALSLCRTLSLEQPWCPVPPFGPWDYPTTVWSCHFFCLNLDSFWMVWRVLWICSLGSGALCWPWGFTTIFKGLPDLHLELIHFHPTVIWGNWGSKWGSDLLKNTKQISSSDHNLGLLTLLPGPSPA